MQPHLLQCVFFTRFEAKEVKDANPCWTFATTTVAIVEKPYHGGKDGGVQRLGETVACCHKATTANTLAKDLTSSSNIAELQRIREVRGVQPQQGRRAQEAFLAVRLKIAEMKDGGEYTP